MGLSVHEGREKTLRRAALLLSLALAFFAAACSNEPDADRFAPTTSGTDGPPETQGPVEPVLIEGSGPEQRTIALERPGPLVLEADVPKGERFRATIQSTRYKLIAFNGRAPFSAPTALPAPGPGPLDVAVATDGEWSLTINQPTPEPSDTRIPGTLSGKGSAVIPVQIPGNPPARLEVEHAGQGTFNAHVFPYEEYEQGLDLVNASGKVERSVALTQPLQGSFLLSVRADGAWTLRFRER